MIQNKITNWQLIYSCRPGVTRLRTFDLVCLLSYNVSDVHSMIDTTNYNSTIRIRFLNLFLSQYYLKVCDMISMNSIIIYYAQ